MASTFTTSLLLGTCLLAALESIGKAGFVPFDAFALSAVNSWIATGAK